MWQEILAVIIPVVLAALGVATPIIIKWLKMQQIIQKMHLEDLLATMIPAVIAWVEYWAEQLTKKGEKPTGEAKLAKAIEFIKNEVPSLNLTTEVVSRIETELKKNNVK